LHALAYGESMTVVVVGATTSGLTSALLLARKGVRVHVVDPHAHADAGTVQIRSSEIEQMPELLFPLTSLETALAESNTELSEIAEISQVHHLARFCFAGAAEFNLTTNVKENARSLATLLGESAARNYEVLVEDAREALRVIGPNFWEKKKPTLRAYCSTALREGPTFLKSALARRNLHLELIRRFGDPLARTIFERYALMLGSDPRQTPATALALHAAELGGAFSIRGGVRALLQGLERAALRAGARFTYNAGDLRARTRKDAITSLDTKSSSLECAALIVARSGAVEGIHEGLIPPSRRSLSAVLWSFIGSIRGRAVARETFLPSFKPEEEWAALFVHETLPDEPSITLYNLDGHDESETPTQGARKFLIRVHVAAQSTPYTEEELDALEKRVFRRLSESGFMTRMGSVKRSAPHDHALGFAPQNGGALYGTNMHGITSPLLRSAIDRAIAGVFFATKQSHPGAMLSMQIASGRLAAWSVLAQLKTR
jgi:1-hydroxycarotenoid 3,4-desaturase